MNININSMKGIWISADYHFTEGTSLFWRDKSEDCILNSLDDQEILDNYSYISSELSSRIGPQKTSANKTREVFLERYGCDYIGNNGGGSRSAKINGLMCKGVGANILLGASSDRLHSDGTQTFSGAIYETIITNFLRQVMPIGACAIRGIISLNAKVSDEAYDHLGTQFRPAYSCILLRDIALRPGNLIPSKHATSQDKPVLESQRIRDIHKQFVNKCNATEITRFIANCLEQHANQFAFAHVAGITHGTISQSNSTLIGEWIDVGNVEILGSQRNHITSYYSAFEEHQIIPRIFENMLFDISIFSKFNLNFTPLAEHYFNCLDNYICIHSGIFFGVPFNISISLFQRKEWKTVSNYLLDFIRNNDAISETPPKTHHIDKLFSLLPGILCDNDKNLTKSEFYDFCKTIDTNQTIYKTRQHLIEALLICFCKRSLLKNIFYSSTVYEGMEEMRDSPTPDKVHDYIERYRDCSLWIFNTIEDEKNFLFRDNLENVELYFDNTLQGYVYKDGNNEKHLKDAEDALNTLLEDDIEVTYHRELFIDYLHRLKNIISLTKAPKS